MSTYDFTTDPTTGLLDLPGGMDVCDKCDTVLPEDEMREFGGRMFCLECHPKCTEPGCNELQCEGGEATFCAKHELETWQSIREDGLKDGDDAAVREADKQIERWKAVANV